MRIWRIQHHESGLGPFYHEPTQQAVRLLNFGTGIMEDIDDIDVVKSILKKHRNRIRFGWSDKCTAIKAIRNLPKLQIEGFDLVELEVDVLFHNPSDNQVVFLV